MKKRVTGRIILLVPTIYFFIFKAQGQYTIRTYYDNEKILLKEFYQIKSKKDRILHGPYRKYYPRGHYELVGRYTNGKKDSVFTEWWPNGQMMRWVTYVNDHKHGPFMVFDTSGIVYQKGTFYLDSLIDTLTVYYPDGVQPKTKAYFNHDRINGHLIQYYPNGQYKQIAEYSNNAPHGITKTFHPDGVTLSSLETFQTGKLHGYFAIYDEKGIKEMDGYNANGVKHGWYKEYFKSGTVAFEATYEQGELNGKATSYFENGNTKGVFYYNRGKKAGYYTLFYPNGNKREEVLVNNELVTLTKKYYFPSGILHRIQNYVGDSKEGEWKYFYSTGKDSISEFYKDGKLTDSRITYYSSGKKMAIETWQNGYLHGLTKNYYPNGKIKSEITYRRGEKSGLARFYRENGKLEAEGNLALGKRNGEWNIYDTQGNLTKIVSYRLDKPIREILPGTKNFKPVEFSEQSTKSGRAAPPTPAYKPMDAKTRAKLNAEKEKQLYQYKPNQPKKQLSR